MAFTRSGARSPSPPLSTRAQPTGSGAQTHSGTQAAVGRLDLGRHAGIAQLAEHNLAKVGVAGSSPVSRSPGRTDGRADCRTEAHMASGVFGPTFGPSDSPTMARLGGPVSKLAGLRTRGA